MEFINAWDKNKLKLKEYLTTTPQSEYDRYDILLEKIITYIINPYYDDGIFDVKDITVIDNGDYQGTLLFIIPTDCYQPYIEDYYYTYVEYGSCSGCDTLLGISSYDDGLPDKTQVNDYMNLCLHIIQRFSKLKK